MKKMILAATLSLLSLGITNARFFGGFGGGCGSCVSAAPVCATPVCTTGCSVGAIGAEAEVPVCLKNIQVPITSYVTKQVSVPANKIVIPQAPLCVRTPQAPICQRLPQPPVPQPDRIQYIAQPDKVSYIQQPSLVRYECPVGSYQASSCCAAPVCATSCGC